MYNEHFGLQQAPFRITPDTRLFFEGGGRGEILDALVYAIVSGEGIVKVIGEVGTGKTMLCRMLEERLPEHVEIVYLANPSLKPDDILQAIALEMNLDIAPGSNRLNVMHAMQQRLLEKHAANRQIVVFVEEAQSMPIETLEEIRLLSNLETKREKLLQIVLFGQPELDENLDQPNIRQLKERITHSFYLEPLNRRDLRDYVNFRMRTVGYRGPDVFRSNAYLRMARASEGLTRRINILADKALLAAFANDRHEVMLKDVRKAVNDSQFESRRRRFPIIAVSLGILILAGATGWSVLDPLRHVAWTSANTVVSSEPATAAPEASEIISPSAAAVTAETPAPTPPQPAAAQKVVFAESAAPTVGTSTPEPERKSTLQVNTAGAELGSRDGAAASYGAALIAAAARAAMLPPNDVADAPGQSTEPTRPAPSGMATVVSADGAIAPEPRNDLANVATSAASDLIAARLAATRQWLSRADNNHYSIQLLLTSRSQRQHVEAFLERRSREGEIDQVYVYETVIDDRPYLGVLYREFSSYSAARRALETLPRDLKRLGPFIRNLRDVTSVG